MHNKHKVDPYIHWKLNSGNYSFWWDDWLGVGPLAMYSNVSNRFNNTSVGSFTHNGDRDIDLITNLGPPQYVPTILATQLYLQQGILG